MTERIVRKAKEYDRDTIPGDYATLATPCPNCGGVVKENYRRFTCTGADGSVGRLRLLDHQDPGRPRLRDRRGRGLPARQEDRPAGRLPLQGRLAVHRRAEAGATTTRSRTGSSSSTSATTPRTARATASRSTSRPSRAWAPAPSARATSTSTAAATSASTRRRARDLRLQERQDHPAAAGAARADDASCWPPARPTLLENFVSNKTRRKFKAFLAWDEKEGKVGFEFEPRPARPAAKAPAKKAAAKKAAGVSDAAGRPGPACARAATRLRCCAVARGAQRPAHRADGLHDGALRVRLAAPPVDGKANARLLAWLAAELGCARRAVRLLRGDASRRKAVEVDLPERRPWPTGWHGCVAAGRRRST